MYKSFFFWEENNWMIDNIYLKPISYLMLLNSFFFLQMKNKRKDHKNNKKEKWLFWGFFYVKISILSRKKISFLYLMAYQPSWVMWCQGISGFKLFIIWINKYFKICQIKIWTLIFLKKHLILRYF